MAAAAAEHRGNSIEVRMIGLKSIIIILILLGCLVDFLLGLFIGERFLVEQQHELSHVDDNKLLMTALIVTFALLQIIAVTLVLSICTYQSRGFQQILWGCFLLPMGAIHSGILLLLTGSLPVSTIMQPAMMMIRFATYSLVSPPMVIWYWALWIQSIVWKQEEEEEYTLLLLSSSSSKVVKNHHKQEQQQQQQLTDLETPLLCTTTANSTTTPNNRSILY